MEKGTKVEFSKFLKDGRMTVNYLAPMGDREQPIVGYFESWGLARYDGSSVTMSVSVAIVQGILDKKFYLVIPTDLKIV